MNAIDDVEMIGELYKASQAGVKIDLIVRGHCRLRPGLRHYSENIRVMSIIGRFLEHSRVYYFNNGGRPLVYFGSADWQRRNLDDRVEAVVPIEDAELRQQLIRILQLCLSDSRLGWDLRPEGHFVQRMPNEGEEHIGCHEALMQRARQRITEKDAPWDID